MRFLNLFFAVLIASAMSVSAQNTMPSLLDNANAGTEFVFSMPPCYEQGGADNFIAVYISSPYETNVKLTIPGLGIVRTMKTVANGVIFFAMSPAEAQPFNKNQNQPAPAQDVYPGAAVVITSDDPIVAYAVTRFQFTSDGAMLAPSAALGTEYVIGSMADMSAMYPGLNLPSETTISAVADQTKIWFTLGGNDLTRTNNGMQPGQTRSYTLNRGDVLAISSVTAGGDLSGSYVRSDKPVAVLSGNQCANVPTTIRWCDYIVSGEMPLSSWSNNYHMPRLSPRPENAWVKIFAAESNTTIKRDGQDFGFIETNKGGLSGTGYLDGQAADGDGRQLVFTADKPISIKFFNPGQELDDITSDPYSIQLTPVDQYGHYVWFCTPGVAQSSFSENYLSLIHVVDPDGTLSEDLEIGTVDGPNIRWRKIRDVFGSTPGGIFTSIGDGKTWAEKRLVMDPVGAFAIRSLGEPFTAYSYGQSNYDTYAFRTGARMSDLTVPDGAPPQNSFTSEGNGTFEGRIQDESDGEVAVGLAAIRVVPENTVNMNIEINDFVPGTVESVEWRAQASDPTEAAAAQIVMVDRRGNSEMIDLSIEPSPTPIEVTPASVDFGTTLVGQSLEEVITITNTSETEALELRTIRLSNNSGAWELSDLPALPLRLLPADGNSERHILRLTVRWVPTNTGEFSNTLLIGAGVEPERVFTTFSARTVSQSFTISDADFGTVWTDENEIATIDLLNDGGAAVQITAVSMPTDPAFTFVDLNADLGELPAMLNPGENKAIRIAFEPLLSNIYNATMEIRFRFGDLDEKSRTVVLSGTGENRPVSVKEAEVTNFGVNAAANPNPASADVQLDFELLTAQLVNIRVYDLRGTLVAELAQQQYPAGVQQVKLDVSALAVGSYFCRLEAGGSVLSLPINVKR